MVVMVVMVVMGLVEAGRVWDGAASSSEGCG